MNRKIFLLSFIVILSLVLGACAPQAEEPVEEPTEEVQEPDVEEPEPEETEEEPASELEPAEIAASLPREETLYYNGLQWGSIVGWNPYSANMNNAMAITENALARMPMFEAPYMYNMLDGQQYPLLADGDWEWNEDMTEITFKIKEAAHWSDGTPVTAEDVAYTWATHVKYETSAGTGNKPYIDTIEAVDEKTVVVKAVLNDEGQAVNPLILPSYLSSNYVMQKAWTQKLEERVGEDPVAFKDDPAEDVVWSGPYTKFYEDDQKVVLVRDDNYWGQDASMWGELPAPKYLVHTIFVDNNAGFLALKAGEVDVSQQFNANVQELWLEEGLPISTYIDEAPYMIAGTMPTAWYNLKSPGLDNVAVRKAIALAVDYDQIIAAAMTNQSPTFDQVPRSLMNPTDGEQALYDQAAVADLQWVGNQIEEANQLLDDAGIVDSDGDGWRDIDGEKLSYNSVCPNGWTDWMAAMEIVADAGEQIGIEITTLFPEWSVYQTVFTDGTQEEYDIFMWSPDGPGMTQPWQRARQFLSSEFVGLTNNWSGNWGGFVNERADELIQLIPFETDQDTLIDYYTELTEIYLKDVPSFALMYRPQVFHTVNESVWTNYPEQGDGTNIPPQLLIDGYGIAGLYNLELVEP